MPTKPNGFPRGREAALREYRDRLLADGFHASGPNGDSFLLWGPCPRVDCFAKANARLDLRDRPLVVHCRTCGHSEPLPEPTGPLLLTWQEYRALAEKEPDGDYVVPGLYRRGQSSLLVGEPKSGKSTLCRRLAVEVAKGGSVLGQRVEAGPVVYLPLQEDPRHVVREMEAVGPVEGVRLWLHDPGQAMEWDRLADALQEIEAALLIVDMLADFRTWEDGNDYVEMKGVVGEFTRLAREAHIHSVVVHHGNKTPMTAYPTARVHGSAAIAGEVDVVASIHRDPKKGRVYQAEGRGISYTEVKL